MSAWNFSSRGKNEKAKALIAELVRVWMRAGVGRSEAIRKAGSDLGISPRKAKCVMYDEPHLLTDLEAQGAELRAETAWRHLADEFAQWVGYCEARAEEARIKQCQGTLDFGKVHQWNFGSGRHKRAA